ncbi:MAG: DUF4446 family protein [Actinomycetota bacterium]|jgi:acid phosphatase family membrane protein YuiD|nr:DUF4446 family protein [Actinomycetota bacterium]
MIDAALVTAVIAIVVALVAVVQVQAMRRKLDSVPADGNLVGLLQSLTATSSANAAAVAQIEGRVSTLEGRLPYAISYIGVVAYDAFGNIAGNQSRSVALLSQRGDGLVITLLVARDSTVFFTKQVSGGRGDETLSPEELAAVDRALGR